MKILIVADDPNLCAYWGAELESRGHDVAAGFSGQWARQALLEEGPLDLVILDLYLGEPVARDLIALAGQARPEAQLVMITGSSDPSPEALMAQAPFGSLLLQKPVDIEDLLGICAGKSLGPGAGQRLQPDLSAQSG